MADRGYVLLWRKFWDSQLFKTSQPFSEREAWLYLFSNLANGIERNGVPRGQFEASRNYLARKWGWAESRVYRFLVKLEAEGMIKKLNRQSDRQSDRFIVCKYEVYQTARTGNRTGNRTAITKEGTNEGKKKETPSAAQGRQECPSDFTRFWIAYPRKVGKGAAEKAWAKIHPTAELLDLILASVELHKRSPTWVKDGGQYIPHPATYLNQRRWEDELKTETKLDRWIESIKEPDVL